MKRKEILPNLTINKCILDSIIKHHNTNTQKYARMAICHFVAKTFFYLCAKFLSILIQAC